MHKYVLNTLGLTAILALCAIAWGAWRVGVLADSVKVPDLSASVAKVNQALDTVNHGCAPGPCGTLAEANKAIVKVSDGIVTTQMQERAIAPATIAAVNSLATIAPHVNPLLDMGTGTLQQARTDLVTADGTIAAAKPVLNNLAATESDLDAAVVENRKNTASLIANGVTISGEVAGMSTDLHHYTHPILNPDPCKTKKCVAGRVAGRIESLLGVADTLHGAETLFTPLKVKVGK